MSLLIWVVVVCVCECVSVWMLSVMDVLIGILKHLCEVSVIAPFFQMRKLRPRPLNHWPRIT